MEEQEGNQISEIEEKDREEAEENVVQFLDSMDSYLTLLDSLSSTLRQGWLELASARQSMGASRISSALFDLKLHSAATTLQVAQLDGDPAVKQPQFTLSKWASSGEEMEVDKEELQKKTNIPQLRGPSQFSAGVSVSHFISSKELQEDYPATNEAPISGNDQVQKERSKSLSVFGTLVSPKLRASQRTFETALEKLVQIANMRSLILSAYAQIRQETEGTFE